MKRTVKDQNSVICNWGYDIEKAPFGTIQKSFAVVVGSSPQTNCAAAEKESLLIQKYINRWSRLRHVWYFWVPAYKYW
jgi:hypothetical protein